MTKPTSTTTKAKRSKGDIKPSVQDPIQRWLDIFMPMTGLPKARQADIRAELEDHLRARVDDLMITGLSEPEAVQQAVNELGETAHLAKQFRTALKPKRITPMHTALIAIAGSALTLGIFSAANLSGSHATLPAQQAASVAAQAEADTDSLADAVPTADYAFAKGGTIDLRTATLTTIFEQVRANLDRPLVIHWEHLDNIGIPKDQPIGLDADPVPTEVALRLAIQRAETEDFGGIAIVDHPDAVEITTTEYLDHRTKQIKPHDIADLIAHYESPTQIPGHVNVTPERNRQTAEKAGREILETIMTLVARDDWGDRGGNLASASVVGGSLIIDAPARIHAEVEQVIDMMQEQIDAFVNARAEADRVEAEAREQSIAELASQMERLEKEILELTMQRNRLAGQNQLIEDQRDILRPQWVKYNPVNQRESADADKFAEVEAELTKLQNEKYMLQFEEGQLKSQIEDKSAYRQSLRERLIELKYAPAEIEAAGNLRRFEETMRRQEARNGARQGKN